MRLSAIDPARRGTIMGLNSAVTYLAGFVGTAAFGPLHTGFGFATSAAAMMLIATLAAAWRKADVIALYPDGEQSCAPSC
jgi:DHA1 family inner membrane transport protein